MTVYKILGLDIGTKRIGVAISDALRITVRGLKVVLREPEDVAIEEIVKIAKENDIKKIVIGLPYNMDGTKGSQAQDCINFADKLTNFEIIFEDERLTSELAEENLKNKKINFKKNKSLVDIESACIILEQYINKL